MSASEKITPSADTPRRADSEAQEQATRYGGTLVRDHVKVLVGPKAGARSREASLRRLQKRIGAGSKEARERSEAGAFLAAALTMFALDDRLRTLASEPINSKEARDALRILRRARSSDAAENEEQVREAERAILRAFWASDASKDEEEARRKLLHVLRSYFEEFEAPEERGPSRSSSEAVSELLEAVLREAKNNDARTAWLEDCEASLRSQRRRKPDPSDLLAGHWLAWIRPARRRPLDAFVMGIGDLADVFASDRRLRLVNDCNYWSRGLSGDWQAVLGDMSVVCSRLNDLLPEGDRDAPESH
jgi:hypothetical protein